MQKNIFTCCRFYTQEYKTHPDVTISVFYKLASIWPHVIVIYQLTFVFRVPPSHRISKVSISNVITDITSWIWCSRLRLALTFRGKMLFFSRWTISIVYVFFRLLSAHVTGINTHSQLIQINLQWQCFAYRAFSLITSKRWYSRSQKKDTTSNHWHVDGHGAYIITWPLCLPITGW